MIVSQTIKDKYPKWEDYISFLPSNIIAVSETRLEEIQLETETHNIFIGREIFTDDLALRQVVEHQIASLKASS